MKKTLLVAISLINFIAHNRVRASSDSLMWLKKADVPYGEVYGPGVATDGHYVYVFGGTREYFSLSQAYKCLYRYDPTTNKWLQLSDLPKALVLSAGAYYNGKLFVCGGEYNEMLGSQTISSDTMFVYNLSLDKWSAIKMPVKGRGLICVVVQDSLYVIKGTKCYRYDITSSVWEERASPPFEVIPPAAVMDNKIYTVGEKRDTAFLLCFDVSMNRWDTLPRIPKNPTTLGFAMGIIHKKVYVCDFDTTQVYDLEHPGIGWQYSTRMPYRRWGMGCANPFGKIHLIGGGEYGRHITSTHQVGVLPIYDAGVEGIILPEEIGVGHKILPIIEVKNCSTHITPYFDVHCLITFENDTVYDTFNIIQNLEGNTTVSETLAPWIPERLGVYQVIAWIKLDGDMNFSNDTLRTSIKVTGIREKPILPKSNFLKIFPNPARGIVDIRYGIRDKGVVKLKVYDVKGRLVKRFLEEKNPGYYALRWKSPCSGIYFLRFKTKDFTKTMKLVLMR